MGLKKLGDSGLLYQMFLRNKYGEGWKCPGGTYSRDPQSGKIYYEDEKRKAHRCSYEPRNADGMKKLHSVHKNANPNGDAREQEYKRNLGKMYDTVKFKFCEDAENRNKNIGGQVTCSKIGNAAKLGREYCQVGDRVKSEFFVFFTISFGVASM